MPSFIPSDCYNVLMECFPGVDPYNPASIARANTLDDMRRMRGVGVGVALEFVPWSLVETERGVYDWRVIDEQVDRAHRAGMKVLLMGPTTVPAYFDDAWYTRAGDGTIMRDRHPQNHTQSWACLSPWNEDATAYQLSFISRMCKRYNDSQTMCIFSQSQEGESLLPPAVYAMFDAAAIASYREWIGDKEAIPNPYARATQWWLHQSLGELVVAQQNIYCNTHPARECWMSLHPCYLGWDGSGVTHIQEYFELVRARVNPASMTWLIFTWWVGAFIDQKGRKHNRHEYDSVLASVQRMGVNIISGSEWPAGLAPHTPLAIKAGFRALLTATLHPFHPENVVNEEVIQLLSESHRQFAAAHNVERMMEAETA